MSSRPHRTLLSCALFFFPLLALFLLLSGSGGSGGLAWAAIQQQQVYLPLVAGGTDAPPPPPPPPGGAALFLNRTVQTNSAYLQIDGNNGVHVAYTPYAATVGENPAYYSYCANTAAAPCGDPASWQTVALSDDVHEVQLQLTRAR
jgi:hypothetical protein